MSLAWETVKWIFSPPMLINTRKGGLWERTMWENLYFYHVTLQVWMGHPNV